MVWGALACAILPTVNTLAAIPGSAMRAASCSRGVTLLGTTADHYAGLHHVVITGTQPDAPFILDGLLDPQTSVRPREIVTDTAGYTDVIFGLFRLLGYQYSPRRRRRRDVLADQPDRPRSPERPRSPPGQHVAGRRPLRRPASRRRQPAATPHDRQPARPGATQPHPPPRLPRPRPTARRPRGEDDPPAGLLQRPALPAAHPDATQPRREPPRPRPRRLPRPPRRTTPALPPRPRRTARRARPDRQRNRPLQHDLHPARPRPPRRDRDARRRRRRRAPQPARDRPHHPHRSLPHRAPRRPTRPWRLPGTQHDAGRRGLTRFSARTLHRPRARTITRPASRSLLSRATSYATAESRRPFSAACEATAFAISRARPGGTALPIWRPTWVKA